MTEARDGSSEGCGDRYRRDRCADQRSRVNALTVKVRAHNGTVTLEGSVTEPLKSMMSAAAKHAQGVKNVVDNVAIKP